MKVFREKPDYAEKRVEARIVTLSPLKLDKKGSEISCTPRSSREVDRLKTGQIVTVSGVVAGINEDALLLSDTIVVPYPEDGQININRKGKRPQGFFAAETLRQQLETAANQVEKGFSIREYISDVRLEGSRAVVDFIENDTPAGVSFSLESLYKDQSSDTLAFNMHLKKEVSNINGYFVLAVVGIVIKASQPDASADEIWEKMESVAKRERRNGKGEGKVMVNGWTYRMNFRDDRNFTFSATAPKRRK